MTLKDCINMYTTAYFEFSFMKTGICNYYGLEKTNNSIVNIRSIMRMAEKEFKNFNYGENELDSLRKTIDTIIEVTKFMTKDSINYSFGGVVTNLNFYGYGFNYLTNENKNYQEELKLVPSYMDTQLYKEFLANRVLEYNKKVLMNTVTNEINQSTLADISTCLKYRDVTFGNNNLYKNPAYVYNLANAIDIIIDYRDIPVLNKESLISINDITMPFTINILTGDSYSSLFYRVTPIYNYAKDKQEIIVYEMLYSKGTMFVSNIKSNNKFKMMDKFYILTEYRIDEENIKLNKDYNLLICKNCPLNGKSKEYCYYENCPLHYKLVNIRNLICNIFTRFKNRNSKLNIVEKNVERNYTNVITEYKPTTDSDYKILTVKEYYNKNKKQLKSLFKSHHASPIEHYRRPHIRHLKNGKIITVKGSIINKNKSSTKAIYKV